MGFATKLLLLILLSTPLSLLAQDPDCTDKWIHIRNLPTKFNLDLLSNCSTYTPLYENFCPYLANHGLGQKTHNNSLSWYRTDPHMLELIFHRRILEYPCLTPDPNEANAVFLPYYASLDAMRYLYGPLYNYSHLHGLELYGYLRENEGYIWERNNGGDHFMVMGRTAWDFAQEMPRGGGDDGDEEERVWGTSILVREEYYNVSMIVLEGRAWGWQEQGVPHPTSFHPGSLAMLEGWVMRVRRARRSVLMVFAGGGGTSVSGSPNIRRSIREECEVSGVGGGGNVSNGGGNGRFEKVCEIIDCSNGVCEHDPIRYMKPMLQASFCLQPPGETPARRSTFDGIIAGCIPVFFEDNSAKNQYQWHLPVDDFDEFSVTIPKEDVVYKGLKVVDVLMKIPKGKVRRMREKVMELIPRVMYRKHGSSLGLRTKKDAFDIAIEGTLQRIKDRLNEVSDTR